MGAIPASRGAIRFDVFEADLQAGELRKQGTKLRLQDQPFQVLRILLEQAGEVITRDELQRRIWPSDTFVDFEQGLYNAIKRLREALDDSADTPRFIETLPRRGYRFLIGSLALKPGRIESLAVLPLENLSRDPEQEYFAEGMTEALINTLAKIGALRVTSRTSAMQYRGVHRPLREIAKELQVDGIIEGTVLRSGDRVRVSAQLIDALTDTHLWAESYDRDVRDILALHSEVAHAIAREIRVKLTPIDQARFAEAHPIEPEAYEAYLKGRYYWNRRSGEGLGKAVRHFQQAISEDPTSALAHTGLADCHSMLGAWGSVPPKEGCRKAKDLAIEAVELDNSLAEAHASLAFATMWDYDFLTAEREFERAIELNPRYAMGHSWYGFYLAMMGRYEEAYTEITRALRIDPHSSAIHYAFGFLYWSWRRYDQAIEQYEKALALEPANAMAHGFLCLAYLCKSQYELAIGAAQKSVQLSRGASSFVALVGEAYAAAGYREDAQKVLEQLREVSKHRYVTPYVVARIYTALGNKDEAFRWLEAGYREREALMVTLKTDPRIDELRPDQRFQELLGRMNFPA